ncbi:alpha/beta hydrolase [Gracilibacillus oryzae]|uniref:Alpha/beta hydrolase n=1 Tax=Gracilibacillus oryzae TaxID=1672701 RepID=A0A7C8GRB5_9BACI|nr:alpha/beta hydrolase [Gracilibacillus oryzae]KAB8127627.1 alpha/beta hydrolase [Gracilibacillus oryzae]
MGKKIIKYLFLSIAVLLVVGIAGFYIWSQQTYQASENLEKLVDNNPKEEDWLLFEPNVETETGIIIYPGAKVEPEAYSYLAQELSKQGYLVGIPEVMLNFAILDSNKADELIKERTDISRWYIGGHSLGGVSASSYAIEQIDNIDGLFFLASYPTANSDLSATELPILSIYAENDGLSTVNEIKKNEVYLSSNATLYKIDGGNHAQFGLYGKQKGDNDATISPKQQQDEIIKVLNDWLDKQSSY